MRKTAKRSKPRKTRVAVPDSFESPESSTIVRAEYDRGTRNAKIQFKRGKQPVYIGGPVTEQQWEEFVSAPSKGAYFQIHLRPHIIFLPEGSTDGPKV